MLNASWHCTRQLTLCILRFRSQHCRDDLYCPPILHMWNLRPGKVKVIAHSHSRKKRWKQDSNPGLQS